MPMLRNNVVAVIDESGPAPGLCGSLELVPDWTRIQSVSKVEIARTLMSGVDEGPEDLATITPYIPNSNGPATSTDPERVLRCAAPGERLRPG
jgi:hypothetical protein